MPTLYMLVGVPGSGKSTYIKNNNLGVVLSTDDFIERVADSQNSTYNDVFKSNIKTATSVMNEMLKTAVAEERNIVWDQTNLTVSSRKNKLSRIPDTYKKIAVVFPTPNNEELQRRLNSRPGKTIPYHIMKSMINNLQYPSKDEGFDEVVVV